MAATSSTTTPTPTTCKQDTDIQTLINRGADVLVLLAQDTEAIKPFLETAQVRDLIRQLKSEGIGIFLISHDIHDVFDLSDRIAVMYHGKIVGIVNKSEVTTDEVLGMIILGLPIEKVTEKEIAQLH